MTGPRRGFAPTTHASRYLQQLCKHWSHRFEVDFDDQRGTIAMPFGRVHLHAAADGLEVVLAPSAEGDVDRMQAVVVEHLERFAFREAPLPFEWRELDPASPGHAPKPAADL